jgi:putative Holliday junction resolvase
MHVRVQPGRFTSILARERIGVHIACDVGDVRVGIARCDPDGILTTPLDAIPAGPQCARVVATIAADSGAVAIVVGHPIGLDGRGGRAAGIAEVWASELAQVTDLPVVMHDERLSTVQAQRRLHETGKDTRRSRAVIDSASAAVILEAYLAAKHDGREQP